MWKSIVFCVLALVMAAGLSAGDVVTTDQSVVQQATAFFEQGVKAAQAGELEEAETLFRRALEIYQLPGAYVELGRIQMARNNPGRAVELYLQAREAFGKLHDQKVKNLLRKQNMDRDFAQEDQQTTKPYAGGFAKMSAEKTHSQRMQDERQVVVPEVEADIPALFYLYLGGAYLRLGKPDLAEQELLKGLVKDSKSAPLQFNLAVACLMMGRYEESADAARKARELGFKLPSQFVADLENRGNLRL